MRARTFGAKLILLITLACSVAVLLVCLVLASLYFTRQRHGAVEEVYSHARVMSIHCAAPLDFGDKQAAAETLSAFHAVPEIAGVTLYDIDGREFASFARAGDPPPYFTPADADRRFHDRWLLHTQPIVKDRRRLGVLLLAYDMAPIYEQTASYVGLSLAVGATAVLVSILFASRLRRRLAGPISALADAARHVSATGDFAYRAVKISDDELGQLTDTFNAMLGHIQARDEGLSRVRRDLADSNRELRQSNAEMAQFVHTASHEIKAPVVTMNGFISIARQELGRGDAAQALDAVARVEAAARRLARRIDGLLTINQIERATETPIPVDSGRVAREVIAEMGPRFREVDATPEIVTPMPVVHVARERLARVFEVLLANAIQHGCVGASPKIEIGARREGGEVRLFVRDRGPGIAAEHQTRIFALFHRLKHDDEGLGIGLTVLGKIAQVHGGRVWVQSRPGAGATFWIALPDRLASSAPEEDRKGATWTPDPSASSSSKTTTATP